MCIIYEWFDNINSSMRDSAVSDMKTKGIAVQL
jgi:hypothetical protein